MADYKTCPKSVSDHTGFRFFPCGNKAVTIAGFCRVHDPDLREERRRKRGPTQWERDMQMLKARREREEAMETRLARLEPLVAAIVTAATTPPPGYEDDGAPGGLWHGHKALDDAVEALVRAERGAP